MKMKRWGGKSEDRPASEWVTSVVDGAEEHEDGRLEAMAHRLDKLLEVVAAMADELDEAAAKRLLERVSSLRAVD